MTIPDNIISFKTIESLNEYSFHIPSYQRGYRWTKQEVEDLLNDINSFQGSWYCLQPLIIKQIKCADNSYEVIDGQQRLTTIYLILKCLEWSKSFQLSYEHKDLKDVFEKLHPNLDKSFDDDIDAYFISNAYLTIKQWFDANKNSPNFTDNLLNKTKVIWYEVRDTDDPREIFTRINSGKITLTDAELIKALFLKQSNFQKTTQPSQLTIASQWDTIQHKLHDDRFWYFLTNDDKNPDASRMALILSLALNKDESEPKNHNFDLFDRYYKNADPIKQWQAVQDTFDILTEWYDDTKLYHRVGYLTTNSSEKLSALLNKYKICKTKSEFQNYLDNEIKNDLRLSKEDLDTLEYHVNDTKIRKVLLLHNVETLAQSGDPTIRFAFDRYKKERWDIEHIHAIADVGERSIKKSDRKRWYDDNKSFAPAEYTDEFIAFCNKLGQQFDGQLLDPTNEQFLNLSDKQFAELKDEQFAELMSFVLGKTDNHLRNLCLLDQGTNRSYKNDSFGAKRQKLIERESGNDQVANGNNRQFILYATRNIFMKYYSKTATNLSQWESQDRADYLEEIKQRIKLYLEN
ncbi:DUF262 domain-containing protein [Moraxella sp. RCAD0137]|uniref:DUF262 domain-containing protein n=1 Tax=Moraxella sp. RCAD0137 TaxID=1775913 RepID=UPI000C9F7458|nr:DUF262 domain-containing protein [Moraxella sp. RCAD0137]PNP97575.1 hypothetical protein AZ602_06860 [Moraxella sp. RCAD0137]